jgi:hypothetical protein
MEYPALEKFIKQMGIVYTIVPGKTWFDPRGGTGVCMHVVVLYKGKVEYDQYHCYVIRSNNKVIYDEGNEVKGVKDGILAYLGDDEMVDDYFDKLARKKALQFYYRD